MYRKIQTNSIQIRKVNNLKYSKTKLPWFSCLLQHSARKRGGLITPPSPHGAQKSTDFDVNRKCNQSGYAHSSMHARTNGQTARTNNASGPIYKMNRSIQCTILSLCDTDPITTKQTQLNSTVLILKLVSK